VHLFWTKLIALIHINGISVNASIGSFESCVGFGAWIVFLVFDYVLLPWFWIFQNVKVVLVFFFFANPCFEKIKIWVLHIYLCFGCSLGNLIWEARICIVNLLFCMVLVCFFGMDLIVYGMCVVDMELKFTWFLSRLLHLTFHYASDAVFCYGFMLIFMTSLKMSFAVFILEVTVILSVF